MVNLDAKALRFMSAEEFRVLTAVEMGMKNHEIVPAPLIESLSGLKRGGVWKLIKMLAKNKLVQHQSIPYHGYRLTSKGYDYLALKALCKRDTVAALGIQIGVGKESDIFTIFTPDQAEVCLKLHRLGRTCFRSVKNNRDYLKPGQHASWIYLSRLSALKEYAFMKALHRHGFPVPVPYDVNRHCVVMGLCSGYVLNSIQKLTHPEVVFDQLMQLIVRLAEHGLIHCDFNEFNLMVDDEEKVTVIDFPQMISTSHVNAQYYFDRDVNCVATFFRRRFGFIASSLPSLARDTARGATALDDELEASGWNAAYEGDLGRLKAAMESQEKEQRTDGDGDGSSTEDSDSGSEGDPGEGLALSAADDAAATEPAHIAEGGGATLDESAAAAVEEAEEADAAAQRRAELAELAELAQVAMGLTATAETDAASAAEAVVGGATAAAEAGVEVAVQAAARGMADAAAGAAEEITGPSTDVAVGASVADSTSVPLSAAALPAAALPVAAQDDDAASVAGSVASTVRTKGGGSSRAESARERVKQELKRGSGRGQGGRSSRNEQKDREKRKLLSGMHKELRGTSGW